MIMAIIDGSYFLGTLRAISAAKDALAADLSVVGLELQRANSKCYICKERRTEGWEQLRG